VIVNTDLFTWCNCKNYSDNCTNRPTAINTTNTATAKHYSPQYIHLVMPLGKVQWSFQSQHSATAASWFHPDSWCHRHVFVPKKPNTTYIHDNMLRLRTANKNILNNLLLLW